MSVWVLCFCVRVKTNCHLVFQQCARVYILRFAQNKMNRYLGACCHVILCYFAILHCQPVIRCHCHCLSVFLSLFLSISTFFLFVFSEWVSVCVFVSIGNVYVHLSKLNGFFAVFTLILACIKYSAIALFRQRFGCCFLQPTNQGYKTSSNKKTYRINPSAHAVNVADAIIVTLHNAHSYANIHWNIIQIEFITYFDGQIWQMMALPLDNSHDQNK